MADKIPQTVYDLVGGAMFVMQVIAAYINSPENGDIHREEPDQSDYLELYRIIFFYGDAGIIQPLGLTKNLAGEIEANLWGGRIPKSEDTVEEYGLEERLAAAVKKFFDPKSPKKELRLEFNPLEEAPATAADLLKEVSERLGNQRLPATVMSELKEEKAVFHITAR